MGLNIQKFVNDESINYIYKIKKMIEQKYQES